VSAAALAAPAAGTTGRGRSTPARACKKDIASLRSSRLRFDCREVLSHAASHSQIPARIQPLECTESQETLPVLPSTAQPAGCGMRSLVQEVLLYKKVVSASVVRYSMKLCNRTFYPALWSTYERDRLMASRIPPLLPHSVLEESRQLRNQSHLWCWMAHDTCKTSKRLQDETKQLLVISTEVVQHHAILAQCPTHQSPG
jgi:hypothetical protein